MEATLRNMMVNNAWIAAKVGTRVYYQSDEQEDNNYKTKFPLITYAHISTKKWQGTKRARLYQITAWAKSYESARELAELIYGLFYQYRPEDGSFNYSDINMLNSIYDNTAKVHGVAITMTVIERKN